MRISLLLTWMSRKLEETTIYIATGNRIKVREWKYSFIVVTLLVALCLPDNKHNNKYLVYRRQYQDVCYLRQVYSS